MRPFIREFACRIVDLDEKSAQNISRKIGEIKEEEGSAATPQSLGSELCMSVVREMPVTNPVRTCRVVALNARKLWWESLQRLFTGKRFVLHPLSDPLPPEPLLSEVLASGPQQGELIPDDPTILLYRDHSATGQCVDWIEATRARDSKAKLVVIVGRLRFSVLVRAMQAGADGFLTEDISSLALVQSLELVIAGERVLPGVLGEFIAQQGLYPLFRERSPDMGLSPRESDILKRLAQGESNKVIANAFGISESTVKGCVKAILKKIAAQNRTQAAVWALNEGLLQSESDSRKPDARASQCDSRAVRQPSIECGPR
jgi:DNA-binding NarL/FixJ family response regulator